MLNRTPYEILNVKPPQKGFVSEYECKTRAEKKCLELASAVYPPKNDDDRDALDLYVNAYFDIRKKMDDEISKERMEMLLAEFKWNTYIQIITKEKVLKIKEFASEIDKIANLDVPHLTQQKSEYISKLIDLKDEIETNLTIQIKTLKNRTVKKCEDILDAHDALNAIRESDGMKVLNNMNNTLKNMDYSSDKLYENAQDLQTLQSQYEIKTKDTPTKMNFARAVASTVMAGLGFITGAILCGIGWSILSALASGLPIIFLPVPMVWGGIVTGKFSYDLAGVPEGTLKHGLTGQTPIYSAAIKATQTGLQFFNPPKPEPEPIVKTTKEDYMKVMLMNHR